MRSRPGFCIRCIVACGFSLAYLVAAAQQIVVEKESPLHASPQLSAKVVAKLKQGTSGEVLAQKGAWVNVRTAEGTGWVQSFNVRFVTPEAAGAPAAIRGGSAPRSKITATIGIRGLEAEDLRQASFDGEQLALLDKYAVTKQDAEAAARSSGLSAARVEYLDK